MVEFALKNHFLTRLVLAALAMAGFLFYFTPDLATWVAEPKLTQAWHLIGLICGGAAIYIVINLLFGLRPRDLRTAGG